MHHACCLAALGFPAPPHVARPGLQTDAHPVRVCAPATARVLGAEGGCAPHLAAPLRVSPSVVALRSTFGRPSQAGTPPQDPPSLWCWPVFRASLQDNQVWFFLVLGSRGVPPGAHRRAIVRSLVTLGWCGEGRRRATSSAGSLQPQGAWAVLRRWANAPLVLKRRDHSTACQGPGRVAPPMD